MPDEVPRDLLERFVHGDDQAFESLFACSSGRSTDGSCGSFMETLGQQIVMLEAALQQAAAAAGVTLTVENGAILITLSP
jgi:hypothetical protein